MPEDQRQALARGEGEVPPVVLPVLGRAAHLEDRLDVAREGVSARYEEVREAVNAGREAAMEARGELEERLERSKSAYRAGVAAAREVAAAEEAED